MADVNHERHAGCSHGESDTVRWHAAPPGGTAVAANTRVHGRLIVPEKVLC
jgi:hypothetical protein